MRLVLACVAGLVGCNESFDMARTADAAPAASASSAATEPAEPPLVRPVESPMPVARQWFEREELAPLLRALPTTNAPSNRAATAKVLVEIRPHATRSDSARVVIDGEVIDDFRTDAGKRLLARWFDAKHLVTGVGMGLPPAGFVLVAHTGIDTDVLVELIAFAVGRRLDGPVELALRRGGTDEITTVPIVLGEVGDPPMSGTWGEWAPTLDRAWLATGADAPLAVSIGAVAGATYTYRDRLPRIRGVTRVVDVETSGSLRSSVAREIVGRHRNEITYCFVQALQRRPSLAGTWTATMTVAADGRVVDPKISPVVEDGKFGACMGHALGRWTFPRMRGDAALSMTYDAEPRH